MLLHQEWWRTSSGVFRDPCQPACSNRAKCWSQILEMGRVRRSGRCRVFGLCKSLRPQDNLELRRKVCYKTFGDCGTGRATTSVVELPMTVQSAGRCSSNSSSGQLLLQRTAWWKSFGLEAIGRRPNQENDLREVELETDLPRTETALRLLREY